MLCTQCGTATTDDTKFCGKCGAAVQATVSTRPVAGIAPVASVQIETAVMRVRPWVRYWARMMDIFLISIVAGLTIGVIAPDALNEKGVDQLFGLACIFAWVFIESLLLFTVGTTPGKWLLKTKLIPPAGTAPSYSVALSRSFKVWWRGMGIGFPLVGLFTLIVAHGNLTRNGITSWDKDDGFTVVHHRIGPLRIIVAVAFCVAFFAMMIVGSVADL